MNANRKTIYDLIAKHNLVATQTKSEARKNDRRSITLLWPTGDVNGFMDTMRQLDFVEKVKFYEATAEAATCRLRITFDDSK